LTDPELDRSIGTTGTVGTALAWNGAIFGKAGDNDSEMSYKGPAMTTTLDDNCWSILRMSDKCIDPADVIGDTIMLALNLIGFKTGQHWSMAAGLVCLRSRKKSKMVQK